MMEMSIPMGDFKLLAHTSKTKSFRKAQGHSQNAADFAFLFIQSCIYYCEANGADMSSFLSHFSVFSSAVVICVTEEQGLLQENDKRRGGFRRGGDCSLSGQKNQQVSRREQAWVSLLAVKSSCHPVAVSDQHALSWVLCASAPSQGPLQVLAERWEVRRTVTSLPATPQWFLLNGGLSWWQCLVMGHFSHCQGSFKPGQGGMQIQEQLRLAHGRFCRLVALAKHPASPAGGFSVLCTRED